MLFGVRGILLIIIVIIINHKHCCDKHPQSDARPNPQPFLLSPLAGDSPRFHFTDINPSQCIQSSPV